MQRIQALLFAVMLTALLSTCDNYEFPTSPYPRVETIAVDNITSAGVTFRGKVIQKGNSAIIDHGFLWGATHKLTFEGSEKLQLGEFAGTNEFTHVLEFGMHKGSTYYVQAYARTSSYVVFGETMSFTSAGSSPAAFLDFFPAEATWGDTITLVGKNFSRVADKNHVTFGGLEAEVVRSSDSTVACVVPANFTEETLPIYLTVFGNKVESPRHFVAVTPLIQNFSPATGILGGVVEITGLKFHKEKEKNIVKFNEHVAEVIEASPTLIRVKVPTTVKVKENEITVTLGAQTGTAPGKFVISPPSIVSLSTDKGFVGETFEITGINFNPTTTGNIVKLGAQTATVVSASKDLLEVVIPADGIYDKRSFKVEVITAGQTAYSGETFVLQDAWLRKQDVPHGRFGRSAATAFAIGGYGYVGLGSGDVGDKFWRYDPHQNDWTEIASFPGGVRDGPTSFVIDGKAYVGLGAAGLAQNDFWRYDPSTGSWDRVADFPYPTFRAVGLSVNGKGYVATLEGTENFWEFDPVTDSWSPLMDVHANGWADSGFVIGDRLFIYEADGTTLPSSLFEYDFGMGHWNTLAGPEEYDPNIVSWTTGFAVNGFGYIRGGYEFYQYDPLRDLWRTGLEGAPGPREHSIAFVIDGKAYFGTSSSGYYDFWEFDPLYLK